MGVRSSRRMRTLVTHKVRLEAFPVMSCTRADIHDGPEHDAPIRGLIH